MRRLLLRRLAPGADRPEAELVAGRPIRESIVARASHDAAARILTVPFFIVETVVTLVGAKLGGFFGGLIGFFGTLGVVFFVMLVLAPFRHRNEARGTVEATRMERQTARQLAERCYELSAEIREFERERTRESPAYVNSLAGVVAQRTEEQEEMTPMLRHLRTRRHTLQTRHLCKKRFSQPVYELVHQLQAEGRISQAAADELLFPSENGKGRSRVARRLEDLSLMLGRT